MTPLDLSTAWDRLRRRLSEDRHYEGYAATVEVAGGRPHLNVVTVGGRGIGWRRLREAAARTGFGADAHIQEIGRSEVDANRLAAYITKGPVEAVRWARRQGASRFDR